MKTKITLLYSLILLSAVANSVMAAPYNHDCKTTEEFRERNGLPGFFQKARAQTPVRVAYFGGSITAAGGWRVKTMDWLKNRFPGTPFTEINAAIPGTGTGFGACRLDTDILAFRPDLVFFEFRVNGGEGFEQQSVEGIIRHIRAAYPETDICFIYTTGFWMRDEINAGRNTAFGQVMEQLADYYGIPSIDLGIEVFRQEQDGKLQFKGDNPENGKLLFSKDGTHPTDAGHGLYTEVLARCLEKMDTANRSTPGKMPPPLFSQPWEKGALIPVERISKSSGWETVDIRNDPVYVNDRTRTDAMLRGAVKCSAAGESITLSWEGTTLGFNDIPYGNPVVLEALIDGTNTVTLTRTQNDMKKKFARYCFLPQQKSGPHTLTLTVKELPEGQSFYLGQFMQAGPLASE